MDLFELSATLGININPFISGLQGALGFAGQIAGQIGDIAVDFGKDVFETGMGFDRQMSAVQAVLGKEEGTIENMNRLRSNALDIAEDSIFTAEETADAYYYMGMAGWKAEQMISGLPGIINLAAASGEDLANTSDIVTDALTAFGLGAGQATHFADVLAQVATNSNTDVARMGKTFQYVAPIAGSLGYSIEDVALSIGLIASSGTKGSMAGTALRNIFTRIATNAGQTKKDLGALDIVTDELGVSFYDSAGRARDWGDVLTEMRASWNELDPKQVDKVTAAFGQFSAESQSASDVMAEFSSDIDNWQTEWNGLNSTIEREKFVKDLEPQFNALGVSMRDSNGNLREFNQVAGDARVILGGLTDQEQMYYGKQIASLRGISALLTLMTSSEADVNKLSSAINNANGAAQDMANTRLDNLWGDLQMFNSAYDIMKVAIYDDVKGPAREIVQEGTQWIKDITDAIGANGLAGGIDMLATHIEQLGDDEHFKSLLESIGGLLGSVVDGMIDKVLPSLQTAAPKLLGALFGGTGEGLTTSGNPITGLIGTVIGGLGGGLGASGNIMSSLFGNLDENKARRDVANSLTSVVTPEVADYAAGEFTNTFTDDWETAQLTDKMFGHFSAADDDVADDLEDSITTGGTDGGATAAVNIEDIMNTSGNTMANMLIADIGGAGPLAGEDLSNGIQDSLSRNPFTIVVDAIVNGLPQGVNVRRNASAMTSGRIFNRPTVFGYADGAYQVAGDAGPEAVVGVSSLSGMIENAVRGAIPVVTPGSQPRQLNVILELDRKELARTVYELNKQETQRVGMSFSNARL